MNQLQLSHKLLGLFLVAVAALSIVSFVSVRSLERADVSQRLIDANTVQRAQMDGDMMHDALRSDVVLCGFAKETSVIEEGIDAIREHSERMRSALREVSTSPEPEVRDALRTTLPAVENYLREAEAFGQAALKSPGAPLPASFNQAFTEVEDRMEGLGDAIEAATRRIAEEAAITRASAARTNLWVSVLCGIGLLVLSLLLVRSIRRPLGSMAAAARAVAMGDVGQTVDFESRDEVGELANALRQMITYVRETAQAAEALGRGDLEITVAPRSPKDTLGHSFVNMKETLARLVRDSNVLIRAARAGDLSCRADASGLSGAFREMIEGENALLAAVDAPLSEAKHVLGRVEARDLTARMHGEYEGDYAAIKVSLNSAIETLELALSEVSTVADGVAAAAEQITQGSATLADSVATQLSTIERITAELSDATRASQQNAIDADVSRSHASDAMGSAGMGSESMSRLSVAVDSMKTAADETAKIVRTIDEIAFQTNLLALNAAVEAARAGDAGRGFAVVAEEVRTLALRSAEAARSTTRVIEQSQKKAEEGVAFNRDASVAFGAIAAQVEKIARAMTEIAESSKKQHAGVARLSTSADSIRDDAQNGAATAQETASAAAELSAQAAAMRQMTSTFTLGQSREGSSAARRPAPHVQVKRSTTTSWSAAHDSDFSESFLASLPLV